MLLFPCSTLHCQLKFSRYRLVWIFSWLLDCIFCIVETCVGFPQLTLSVMQLACIYLGSQGPPCISWGLWGSGSLPQLPEPSLCAVGLVSTCLSSSGPPSASWDLYCSYFISPACTLCCRVCVFFLWLPRPTLCAMKFVCTAEVCMPPSLSIQAHPLHRTCCVHWQGLYARPLLDTWAHPLYHKHCVHW